MKKRFCLSLVLCAALLLAACTPPAWEVPGRSEISEEPIQPGSQSMAAPSAGSSGPASARPADIWVERATETQTPVYEHWGEPLSLYTSLPYRDVSIIGIGRNWDGEAYALFQDEVLHVVEEWAPDKPITIAVTTAGSGALPRRGIAFVDETGRQRYLYVVEDYQNETLALEEFENIPPSVWITDGGEHPADYGEDGIDHMSEYGGYAGHVFALHARAAYKNFCYSTLGYTFLEDHSAVYYEEQVEYSLDVWEPGKPIYIKVYLPEIMPRNGISFEDENGVRRYYYIIGSGMDDYVSFVEYENTPPV